MEKKYLAKWETSCGKDFIKLYKNDYAGKTRFYYDTRTGGGNIGNKAPNLDEAIKYVELHVLSYMLKDHKSLRRTL